MLRKANRLNRAQFNDVFTSGKRYHSPFVQIIVDKNTPFHGAVVVGKKVYKKAVDRNTLRRRLYGALYRYYKTTKVSGTYIIIAKPATKKATRKEILDDIEKVLAKIS